MNCPECEFGWVEQNETVTRQRHYLHAGKTLSLTYECYLCAVCDTEYLLPDVVKVIETLRECEDY